MMTLYEPLALRPYQEEAIGAVWSFWENDAGKHPLVVLPTGAGKSLTMAELCRRAVEWPGTRIMVLAHRGELIQQNAEAIERQVGMRVGVYSAGLRRRETEYSITVASIQSVFRMAPRLDPFDLIIIDEAHRIPPDGTTRYRRFLSEAALQNPNVRYIGFTATPFRMGSGRLDEGDDALFDAIVYNADVGQLIRDGYLCEVVSRGGVQKIDTTGVRIRGGEYVAGELERAADNPDITRAAVEEIVKFGEDRAGWLVFATGVNHAYHILEELRQRSVPADIVTGETDMVTRARTIQAFKERRLRCLVSVEVFLEGFNAPHVDLIGMLRPTKSPVLYIQAVGRGLRTAPEKTDCLLLDYAGVVAELGPIDQVSVSGPRSSSGDGGPTTPPAKECPHCRLIVAPATRQCAGCGFEWPPPEPKLQANAYGGAVLSHQQPTEMLWVHEMTLERWQARDPAKPDTLLITYRTNVREVREWVCPDHVGYARQRFEARCVKEWGITPPGSLEDTLDIVDEIPSPTAILVRPQKDNPKYLEVVRRLYDDTVMQEAYPRWAAEVDGPAGVASAVGREPTVPADDELEIPF